MISGFILVVSCWTFCYRSIEKSSELIVAGNWCYQSVEKSNGSIVAGNWFCKTIANSYRRHRINAGNRSVMKGNASSHLGSLCWMILVKWKILSLATVLCDPDCAFWVAATTVELLTYFSLFALQLSSVSSYLNILYFFYNQNLVKLWWLDYYR